MPQFSGINHIAFTVRDLDVSERFYCDLLDFVMVLDIGYGRLSLHKPTGFTIALLRPAGASGDTFSPLRTGLDHLGLAAGTRDELVAWERRLQAAGVATSPIQDMPSGTTSTSPIPTGSPSSSRRRTPSTSPPSPS